MRTTISGRSRFSSTEIAGINGVILPEVLMGALLDKKVLNWLLSGRSLLFVSLVNPLGFIQVETTDPPQVILVLTITVNQCDQGGKCYGSYKTSG